MKRRLAAIAAIVAIAVIVVLVAMRRRRREVDALAETREPTDLVEATLRAATLSRIETIVPYGLTAKVDDGWACHPGENGNQPTCEASQWSVSWKITPDAAAGTLDDVVARAVAESPTDPESGVTALGTHVLAGFRGVARKNEGGRRPYLDYRFDGWLDVPRRGRLHLAVLAECLTFARERDRAIGLAVLLTTSGAPSAEWLATIEGR